ncbi:glycosyltransferase family 4 protein [Paenibacillus sp. YN15]|uniref:glycosyltransferase family 4 protein n=1 Tax=Paenibacillus sp. YN15 TaxID=1742774 RepID=UPI000DCE7C7F|nr:glycosyltransferase family 4 protein [Paenibacillus sp. YN15]RAV01299.1 glycosyltransferase family 1 protein [Paenibacillus sp. YN15]
MKPKIALVSPGSFIIPSGVSSSVEQVMEELANRIGLSTDCTVYGIRAPGVPGREIRGPVRYLRPSGRKNYLSAVIKSLRRESYDLIQVDNRPRMARAVKKALPGKRVWLALHSLTFVSRRHIGRQELADCFRHVERILVNSRYLEEEIARLVPEAALKLQVLYPGVNTGLFLPRWDGEGARLREEKLRVMGYGGKRIILYAGRLREIKGVHHLLEAMPRLAAQFPDAVLLVVGGAFYGSGRTTGYVRKLHRMARSLPRNVRFVPYVPHERMPEWFRLADVAVVPSPRREAFGLVNVEAMASGVPVVAADSGGMREIILHGETGYLVPVESLSEGIADAVGRLLADQGLARRMGERAAVRVREQFTWEGTAALWLALAGFRL